jgi:ABC-type phosphate/phosphonate transport system substrate-binding protein
MLDSSGNPGPILPFRILRDAIKAVPAVKYALGVAGIAATVAIVFSLGIRPEVALWGVLVTFVLMAILVVFAKLSAMPGTPFRLPALVLTWYSLAQLIVATGLMNSSVFFKWPLDLSSLIVRPPLGNLLQSQETVFLAFTPHGIHKNQHRVEERYTDEFIIKANEDPAIRGKYKFVPLVPGNSYDSVFDALRDGKALLGFMSPLNYLLLKYDKKTPFNRRDFQIVGVKTYHDESFYSSWFAVNSNCSLVQNLTDLTAENFDAQRIHFVLGANTSSTSTYRVPMVFLMERGIVLDLIQRNFEKVDRWDMLDRVRGGVPDNCVVGVLSDDDWDSLEPSEKLGVRHLAIPVPIPFDPLLVYRKSWQVLPDQEKTALLRALAHAGSFRETPEWTYQSFENYIASAVITRKLKEPGDWESIVPDRSFDLYGLRERWAGGTHDVVLVRADNGVSMSGDYNVQETRLGNCTLVMEAANRARTHCDQNLGELQGAHVLPPALASVAASPRIGKALR